MAKKLLVLLLILPLSMSGCKSNRRIETATVIENISVQRLGGQLVYTFYPLTDSETPEAVDIPAPSLEEAQRLAQKQYIPNLSLAKLELILIHKNAVSDVMQGDIGYISTRASFSPVAYVALCDGGTLKRMRESTRVQRTIENRLLLCRSHHPDVCLDYLSVYNSYARGCCFSVPFICGGDELKVSAVTFPSQKENG